MQAKQCGENNILYLQPERPGMVIHKIRLEACDEKRGGLCRKERDLNRSAREQERRWLHSVGAYTREK